MQQQYPVRKEMIVNEQTKNVLSYRTKWEGDNSITLRKMKEEQWLFTNLIQSNSD